MEVRWRGWCGFWGRVRWQVIEGGEMVIEDWSGLNNSKLQVLHFRTQRLRTDA